MASGRKPKPVSQKLLAGNPGKRKLNIAEPKFSEITHIESPEWLDDLASQMWQRIIPELLKEKVLCSTDLHNVECFCVAYSRWRQSEQDVVKYGIVVESGNGSLTKNPALTAANESMMQIVKFGSSLGLSPSDRARLVGNKNSESDNEFAEFLKNE